MAKTYDGREIGKLYRFLPAREEAKIKLLAKASIASIAIGPFLGIFLGISILPGIVLGLLLAYFCHFQITATRYRLTSEDPRHFTMYKVVRESIDDYGNVSTLVRWEASGEHDIIRKALPKRQSFGFIEG